jgi:hypothetical protein
MSWIAREREKVAALSPAPFELESAPGEEKGMSIGSLRTMEMIMMSHGNHGGGVV